MTRWFVAVAMALFLAGCCGGGFSRAGLTSPTSQTGPTEPSLADITFPSPLDVASLERLDLATASTETDSDLAWFDGRAFPVEGRGWDDTETYWERLPARAKGKVTEAVWGLSKNTAGICVRFVTDSTQISAAWDGGAAMNHMAATGNSGLDLYARRDGLWVYVGTGRPKTTRTVSRLARELPKTPTEYLLYLPLYNKVTELKIGFDPGSLVARAPARPAERVKPIVFYGTSITQGGCASRAGMAHAQILGRWLDRPVINLGFSGSGKMEPAMAELEAELDPAVYVLDCLPNMTTPMVKERVVPFVKTLRAARPDTPILLVSSPFTWEDEPGGIVVLPLAPASSRYTHETLPANIALREAFSALQAEGVSNLHLLEANHFDAGLENGAVDGIHPTDLGFYRMAVAFYPTLRDLTARGR